MTLKESTNKIVLIVEDDVAINNLLQKTLGSKYKVESAMDGQVALDRLHQKPMPDLLICDVMIPSMSGFKVADEIRTHQDTKHIPIIFLTAKARSQDIIQGINHGARHYITKPFNMADVISKVQNILG
jgi:DNA-binding response OmpR family regulator